MADRGSGGAVRSAASADAKSSFDRLDTPCLLLDADRMDRNINRLRSHLAPHAVTFRPHLKTAKSVQVAQRLMSSPSGPATVSTLREAEFFAAAGVRDITYAVGIEPGKINRIIELLKADIDIAVVLDSPEQAILVAKSSRLAGIKIPALIEIDCDGHRSGVSPDNLETLLQIGRTLQEGAELRGVLAHAGGSYAARGVKALVRHADEERRAAVNAAEALRADGLGCSVVSVGSTPTAHHAVDFSGVTEVRAGVYAFFDLVMAGIGVCAIDDIALSVLTTVVGHQREKGWIVVDAGWMALSRDRGTSSQAIDQGYGVVCDRYGTPYPDLIVAQANQEHGIVTLRPNAQGPLPSLPLGTRLRILPNHACSTGAQHDGYHVVRGRSEQVEAVWPRIRGW